MTRYLRLGYLIPRLVLLVVLFCLVEFGSGYALRYAIISGGEQAIGARVEVGESVVSVFDARATLADIRLANPQRPMENLLEADSLQLDFDADSLLRRKAIADHGVVRGLRFGTPRETSGALVPTEPQDAGGDAPVWLTAAAEKAVAQAADEWIAGLESKLSASADEFESVALANELSETWPGRFEAFAADARQVQDDVDALRRVAEDARSNPLRHAEFLRSAPQKAAELKQRLASLHTRLAALPAEVAADKQRIDGARLRDEQRLRERLQVNQLDPQSLTTQLLGDQMTGSLGELIAWVRWTREMMPSRKAPRGTTPRDRGMDVSFVGVRQRPDLLIRQLEVSGATRLAGRAVELNGLISDFTTTPALHGKPMEIELSTTGALPLQVRATIDRTGATPADRLLVDCPAFDLPAAQLGDAAKFGLSMDPSTASLSVSLQIDGEQLAGEVQLVQDRVALTPQVGPNAGTLVRRLGSLAGDQVASLKKPATRVTLSGSLDDPKMAIWSTLGPAVAESLEKAATEVARAEVEGRVAQMKGRVASEMRVLDDLLANATGRLAAEIDAPQQEIQKLASRWIGDQLGRGTFSFEQLGKRLPTGGSLFK